MKRPSRSTGLLSSGSLPFWKQSKPALAVDTVDPVTGEEPIPVPNRAIASIAKGLAIVLAVLVGFTAASWLILGVTVMPTPRVDGEAWAVKWAAWPEGAVPPGSLVAVVDGPVGRDLPSRFGYQFGSGNITIQRVIAGPGGTVTTTDSGEVLWNGEPTGATSNGLIADEQLGDAYLTACVVGECGAVGTAQIVPTNSIMGEALGTYTPPFRIEAPATPVTPVATPTPSPSPEAVDAP